MNTTKKHIRIPTQVHTRELDRAVAKANMKKGGLRQYCKGSFFSENWRKFADPTAYIKKHKEERAKGETEVTPVNKN